MGAQAAAIGERIRKQITDACKMLTLEIVKELKQQPPAGTPVDTGHARRNWIPSVGAPNTVQATSAAPAHAGTQAVLAYQLSQGTLWVANVVPYIRRLNYGHSEQSPTGFVEAAVDRALTTTRQRLAKRGSSVTLDDFQAEFRSELGGDIAENLADAYSPFGGL